MYKFIKGKINSTEKSNKKSKKAKKPKEQGFSDESFYIKSLIPTKPLKFSDEALEVFEAEQKLWSYYHKGRI